MEPKRWKIMPQILQKISNEPERSLKSLSLTTRRTIPQHTIFAIHFIKTIYNRTISTIEWNQKWTYTRKSGHYQPYISQQFSKLYQEYFKQFLPTLAEWHILNRHEHLAKNKPNHKLNANLQEFAHATHGIGTRWEKTRS